MNVYVYVYVLTWSTATESSNLFSSKSLAWKDPRSAMSRGIMTRRYNLSIHLHRLASCAAAAQAGRRSALIRECARENETASHDSWQIDSLLAFSSQLLNSFDNKMVEAVDVAEPEEVDQGDAIGIDRGEHLLIPAPEQLRASIQVLRLSPLPGSGPSPQSEATAPARQGGDGRVHMFACA